jgi:hypothetical protein
MCRWQAAPARSPRLASPALIARKRFLSLRASSTARNHANSGGSQAALVAAWLKQVSR